MNSFKLIRLKLTVYWWCIFAPAKYKEYKKFKAAVKKAFESPEIKELYLKVIEKSLNVHKGNEEEKRN